MADTPNAICNDSVVGSFSRSHAATIITALPRLLNKAHAAAYVDMSVSAFQRHCTVKPISFYDERLLRWDRIDLDEWVDSLKQYPGESQRVMTRADMDRINDAFEG